MECDILGNSIGFILLQGSVGIMALVLSLMETYTNFNYVCMEKNSCNAGLKFQK